MFDFPDRKLSLEQLNAIACPHSVLLVACPGSGKTRTLTYKIVDELSKLNGHRKFVIAITYTHRAADEILDRIEHLGVDTKQLWIGTIHAFCLNWIIKPYSMYDDRLKYGFTVINSHDSEAIIEDLCKKYTNPKITYYDCPHYYDSGKVKLGSRDKKKHENIKLVLREYFSILNKNQQIDFEQILYYADKLITNHPLISNALSSIFTSILIDEYQDTKNIQYSIICKILASGEGKTKTFIVGDPNQSIFTSLGGYPIEHGDLSQLSGLYIEKMNLTKNYRSSEKIIQYCHNYNVFATKVEAFSEDKSYPSLVTYNKSLSATDLEDEIIRLIRHSISDLDISENEICIVGPQWVHLASLTRRLVHRLPEYNFDGPGMVPFGRDYDNFWYKLSRIILSKPSPEMYSRRSRWAQEILDDLSTTGVSLEVSKREMLKQINAIEIDERDGLTYLKKFFDKFCEAFVIDFAIYPTLLNHHSSFFESSQRRIERLRKDGTSFIDDIDSFRKVFQPRKGITVSTIHGVKGAEFDNVIAFALLEGMVPHFQDPDGDTSAKKLLYVISSRARKNLFLISERRNGKEPTNVLNQCKFSYSPQP